MSSPILAVIRPEQVRDATGMDQVLRRAFGTEEEVRLVRALRENAHITLSLVAELEQQVVGCIVFSPLRDAGGERIPGAFGLAPVAVCPAQQGRGIGSRLIREAIEHLRRSGVGFIVVLGHEAFYPRFGFAPASRRGLQNEYGVEGPFMVLELIPDILLERRGLVRYGEEFASL